jgi:hypothetical protein
MKSLHSAFHALLPDIFIALERPLCGRPSHPRELPVTLLQCGESLTRTGRAQRAAIDRQDQALDFEPVVKLFTPDGNATWLLTELNPDIDLPFGLCDLGLGQPELGYVSLLELTAVRGPLGLPLERDLHFAPTRTIAAYAELAREHRRIVT